MSSTHIVPITQVSSIESHPDPETTNLEIISLANLGWQLVVRKGIFSVGQKVVYVPPQSMMPQALSDCLQVTQYLSKGRVRSVRLRGEPSFGLVFTPDSEQVEHWQLGENVADYYGITKYIPPVRMLSDDCEPEIPYFERYTDIENLRNFPTLLEEGEPVIVTEKIEGTNTRIAKIDGFVTCGSFRTQKKRPVSLTPEEVEAGKKPGLQSLYWYPYESIPGVRELLEQLGSIYRYVIIYGEVYGPGVRPSFPYGIPNGKVGFAVFDIFCDGKYTSWPVVARVCSKHGVATVPVVAQIPYSLGAIKRLSSGQTTIDHADKSGIHGYQRPTHIREGVVVRPLRERTNPQTGRTIFKYVSDTYLLKQSKGEIEDFTDS